MIINDKNNVFNTFQQYVAAVLVPPCKTFTPPFKTQALERTERYFEDYTWQSNNSNWPVYKGRRDRV